MLTLNKKENGNVFFYILLAIALFAALSYAVSQNNRGSSNIFTDEQAKLSAQEIIEYGNIVANAVQKLRLRGCSDTEISFDNSVVTGYNNPTSPSDKSCDVFDLKGGDINFTVPSSGVSPLDWFFDSGFYLIGAGTDAASTGQDLVILLPGLSETICQEINEKLNHGFTAPPVNNGNIFENADDKFIGTYISGAESDSITGHPSDNDCTPVRPLCGKLSACFKENTGNQYYIFYQLLIVR